MSTIKPMPCRTEQECEAPDLCRETNGCERMEPPTRGTPGTGAPKPIEIHHLALMKNAAETATRANEEPYNWLLQIAAKNQADAAADVWKQITDLAPCKAKS